MTAESENYNFFVRVVLKGQCNYRRARCFEIRLPNLLLFITQICICRLLDCVSISAKLYYPVFRTQLCACGMIFYFFVHWCCWCWNIEKISAKHPELRVRAFHYRLSPKLTAVGLWRHGQVDNLKWKVLLMWFSQ